MVGKGLSRVTGPIEERLIEWFSLNGRRFPWRVRKQTPYRALVTEVLLQRTKASSVASVEKQFFSKYKTPRALAKAAPDDVLEELRSLGLFWRTRNLPILAKAIVSRGGRVPINQEELTALPGVGRYAATAYRVFHLGERDIVLDSNVARILCRIAGISLPRDPHKSRRVQDLSAGFRDCRNPKCLNWAFIDFAASVCVPRTPHCVRCPINEFCVEGRRSVKVKLAETRKARS